MNVLNDSNIILNIVYISIMLTTVAGSIIAFKVGIARTATEVQERVINALNSEIKSLTDRIVDLEKENINLKQTMGLIKSALRKRGLSVTIEGDLVTIESSNGTTQTGRIHGAGDR